MTKWVIAMGGLIILMGMLVWQLSPSEPPKVEIPVFDANPTVAVSASDAASYKPRQVRADAAPGTSTEAQLDSQSEEFSHRLDVSIPDGFRASLSRCNRKGFDPDAKITIAYRLHIEKGVVSASRVRVEKSDLGDAALEQCMVNSVQQARWQASDLPDFAEDQQIFIRIRSLNKYLDKREQEEAKAADKVEE